MTRQNQIITKLEQHFSPLHLSVIDESHQHRGASDAETHFKIVVISHLFEGKRALARHREIYLLLTEELQQGLHALAVHAYTPQEWLAKGESFPLSPKCGGGQ